MSEDISYRPNKNFSTEENAENLSRFETYQQSQIENFIKESEPLEKRWIEFTNDARDWMFDNWFEKHNVNPADIHEINIIRNTHLMDEDEFGITSPYGYIGVNTEKIKGDFQDPDIQDYITARVLMEEIYHATAKPEITTSTDSNAENLVFIDNKVGLSFKHRDEYGRTDSVFEEGMAQLFIDNSEEFLTDKFPEGRRKFKELESNNPELMVVHPEAKALASEILEAVDGDLGLLERARIYSEHMPLARKLKAVYGESVYSKTMSAHEYNAEFTAKKLKETRLARS